MKKLILSALALIGCLSLASCSNEEKPLKTIQLKENQVLTIDKYKFDFGYTDCFYPTSSLESDTIWNQGKLQNLPYTYSKVVLAIYSTSIKIEVNFDLDLINKLIEDYKKEPVNTGSNLIIGQDSTLYTSKDFGSKNLGTGIYIDSKTNTFIYSPESFDYSDYSLTFNANTTPYELKEVSK